MKPFDHRVNLVREEVVQALAMLIDREVPTLTVREEQPR